MTEDINHFVEEYRLYVHNADERNKVVSRAVNALGDTCTEELLIKKSKELDYKRIKKFAKMFLDNPDSFVRKCKLQDRIPKEVLPCIVHMDGLGRIMCNNSISSGSELKFLTFIFKIDESYKVSGFRC